MTMVMNVHDVDGCDVSEHVLRMPVYKHHVPQV